MAVFLHVHVVHFFVNAQLICTSGALCRELYLIVTVLF